MKLQFMLLTFLLAVCILSAYTQLNLKPNLLGGLYN